ncbi:hypothetical protein KQ725_15540, partial [Listeria monocytogenes]|nr:hypothetical protein [Listeria monocytogenes]
PYEQQLLYDWIAGDWQAPAPADRDPLAPLAEPATAGGDVDAEQVALDSGIPATRVRLAGIYGPGREWLLNQVRQGYRVVSEPPLYANRIHAD